MIGADVGAGQLIPDRGDAHGAGFRAHAASVAADRILAQGEGPAAVEQAGQHAHRAEPAPEPAGHRETDQVKREQDEASIAEETKRPFRAGQGWVGSQTAADHRADLLAGADFAQRENG